MQRLRNNEAEIVFGRLHPRPDIHEAVDFTVQYTQDELVWVVSSNDFIPFVMAMLFVFDNGIWIGCVLSYASVCLVVWRIAGKLRAESANLQRLSFIAWNALGMLVGQSPLLRPRTVKVRMLVFIWAWFCIHWTSVYTSILISVITKPPRNRMVRTYIHNKLIAKSC